jgi:hypothetical protein
LGQRKDSRRASRDRRDNRFVKRAVTEASNQGFSDLEEALQDEEFYKFLELLAQGIDDE